MRSRNGYTLIEMLAVFTLIGLLSATVVLQVRRFRERALTTVMKSDLRNFAIAQESYYYDKDVYASDLTMLADRGYHLTAGVLITVNEATVSGWSATAEHTGTLVRCYLYVPGAAPVGVADQPGIVACG
jgi:prepilin-type N-terminal cleavage/methylation domain-containing protein